MNYVQPGSGSQSVSRGHQAWQGPLPDPSHAATLPNCKGVVVDGWAVTDGQGTGRSIFASSETRGPDSESLRDFNIRLFGRECRPERMSRSRTGYFRFEPIRGGTKCLRLSGSTAQLVAAAKLFQAQSVQQKDQANSKGMSADETASSVKKPSATPKLESS